MLSILRDAHGEVIEAFDSMISMIPVQDIWRQREVRRAVQDFMASESVRDAEEAINRQCMIVITGDTEEGRETAFKRVVEGIGYWKKLVMWKIGGGK
jgi:transcriptional regulator of acetoin/glycerol metabolism